MKSNYKRFGIVIALAALVSIAGCGMIGGNGGGSNNTGEQLANSTNANVSGVTPGESYYYEVKVTEKNQRGLVTEHPPFVMDSSLERQNLIQRYKYLNDETNVHHVYLMDEGQVVSYYVAEGKVSSVNSKLTNDKQIVRVEGCKRYTDGSGGGYGYTNGNCFRTVESPQMDGSYGTNGEAIFFFTTDGAYVQTSLDYVVSERPMNIQDEIILTGGSSNATAGAT